MDNLYTALAKATSTEDANSGLFSKDRLNSITCLCLLLVIPVHITQPPWGGILECFSFNSSSEMKCTVVSKPKKNN